MAVPHVFVLVGLNRCHNFQASFGFLRHGSLTYLYHSWQQRNGVREPFHGTQSTSVTLYIWFFKHISPLGGNQPCGTNCQNRGQPHSKPNDDQSLIKVVVFQFKPEGLGDAGVGSDVGGVWHV